METGRDNLQEGEDEVRYAWPLWAGLYMCYNGIYNEQQDRKVKQISKKYLSTDWALKLRPMKMESLVNTDQNAVLNTFSSPVHTARHITEADSI